MSVVASIRSQFVPISREGYPFIGAFALASLVLFVVWSPLGWLGTLATAWCAFFFRDPPRVTPLDKSFMPTPGAFAMPSAGWAIRFIREPSRSSRSKPAPKPKPWSCVMHWNRAV